MIKGLIYFFYTLFQISTSSLSFPLKLRHEKLFARKTINSISFKLNNLKSSTDDNSKPTSPPIILFDRNDDNFFSSIDVKLSKRNVDEFKKEDFQRADIPIITPKIELETVKDSINPLRSSSKPSNKKIDPKFYDDNAQPTGYDTFDEKDIDEPGWEPITSENDSELVKFFKNVYIGSPYDSKNKKEARFVVRSVTLISFAIGIVFTVLWYAFPGKFISNRGSMDLETRYQPRLVVPDKLLDDEFRPMDENTLRSEKLKQFQNDELFDDAANLPPKEIRNFEPTKRTDLVKERLQLSEDL